MISETEVRCTFDRDYFRNHALGIICTVLQRAVIVHEPDTATGIFYGFSERSSRFDINILKTFFVMSAERESPCFSVFSSDCNPAWQLPRSVVAPYAARATNHRRTYHSRLHRAEISGMCSRHSHYRVLS